MNIKQQFEKLFNNELSTEDARSFLIDLYEKGESGSDIAAAAAVMREHSVKLPLSTEVQEKAIDVVGTGGDKSGSFNISTTVSLLLASLGCVVAKHGNRSITSNSGSADALEALGINLDLSIENKIKERQDYIDDAKNRIEIMGKAGASKLISKSAINIIETMILISRIQNVSLSSILNEIHLEFKDETNPTYANSMKKSLSAIAKEFEYRKVQEKIIDRE